jgi:hypothetical protein
MSIFDFSVGMMLPLLLGAGPLSLSQANQPAPKTGIWTPYTNARYHYTLSYTGTLGLDRSTPAVELLYITIDPKAEPIHVCAADNATSWTAVQLFEHWRQEPPPSGSEFPCGFCGQDRYPPSISGHKLSRSI